MVTPTRFDIWAQRGAIALNLSASFTKLMIFRVNLPQITGLFSLKLSRLQLLNLDCGEQELTKFVLIELFVKDIIATINQFLKC